MKCPKCHTDNPDTQKFCGECASPLTVVEDAQPSLTKTIESAREELTSGSAFAGRYQIIEELGKGGMGKVYKALDKEIQEKIAIKLIKPEIASDQKTIERFRHELKTARMISHRNVCRMFDLNKEGNNYFITMEYVSGGDLKKFIRRAKRLDMGTALSIAGQICEGLEEAHNLGIVHRDLKPNNIMIDDNGNARIMDFGIARPVKGKHLTGSGVMIGTPEYMSPEQVEAKETDQRSDIYSLGIILYEMTTGRLPFEADSPFAIGVKHKSEIPADPIELNAHIPRELSQIILKCLEKDKKDRYQNIRELRSELQRIEQEVPSAEVTVPKRKTVPSKEITVSLNVRKVFLPAVLVVAVIVAVILIWKPWGKKFAAPTSSGKTSLAVLYFKNNTGDDKLEFWRTALSDSIITDLSQSKYFDVLSSDRLFGILRRMDLLEAENYASEELRELAAEGGVDHILTGSLSRAGDTFRIEYSIQDISTGKIRGSNRVEGKGDASIFAMVDTITKELKREFHLSRTQIAGDIDREVESITTGSTEALKFYSEGRRAHNLGEYENSIALMESAVAADPEFAMAYRSIAMSNSNLRYYAKYEEYMRKAFELSHRLTDRERLLIEGDFYQQSQMTYDKALKAYDRLLELYPDDSIAANNSGNIYSSLEQWDAAIERYQVSVEQKDPSIQSYTNLANMYQDKGQHDEAVAVLRDYFKNFQDSAEGRSTLARIYIGQRKLDLALEEIDRAFSLNPRDPSILFNRGLILYFKDEIEPAALEFRKLLERENPVGQMIGNLGMLLLASLQGKYGEAIEYSEKAIELCRAFKQAGWEFNFLIYLGDIYRDLGRLEEALTQYDLAWQNAVERNALAQQQRLLVSKGVYFLRNSSIPDALETADRLKALIESGLNPKAMRKYYYLMARIEYEMENYSGAVEHLRSARSMLPSEHEYFDVQAVYYFALGQAYEKLGEMREAQSVFSEVIASTSGRIFNTDIYVRAYYELGKIYQAQEDSAKAIENFEKFLDLWKDADRNIPEVADAKARLSALR
jgi:serine/threonine protein kinase/tetratricopeptide (TPR) repeat protein